jgi:hypothetical protein
MNRRRWLNRTRFSIGSISNDDPVRGHSPAPVFLKVTSSTPRPCPSCQCWGRSAQLPHRQLRLALISGFRSRPIDRIPANLAPVTDTGRSVGLSVLVGAESTFFVAPGPFLSACEARRVVCCPSPAGRCANRERGRRPERRTGQGLPARRSRSDSACLLT